jgi:hypothetical protein
MALILTRSNTLNSITVTHWADREQFRIQCRSMGRWLQTAPHTVILNELDPSTAQDLEHYYYQECAPWLRNRPVRLWHARELIDRYYSEDLALVNGYIRQQVFKFYTQQILHKDSIILDSKNWYARKTTLAQTPQQSTAWWWDPSRQDTWHAWSQYLADHLNTHEPRWIRCIETPYRLSNKQAQQAIQRHWGTWAQFVDAIITHHTPSEFMALNLAETLGKPKLRRGRDDYTKIIWRNYTRQEWLHVINTYTVVGVHKSVRVDLAELEHDLFER